MIFAFSKSTYEEEYAVLYLVLVFLPLTWSHLAQGPPVRFHCFVNGEVFCFGCHSLGISSLTDGRPGGFHILGVVSSVWETLMVRGLSERPIAFPLCTSQRSCGSIWQSWELHFCPQWFCPQLRRLPFALLALLFVFNVHVGAHDIPQADPKTMILLPEPPHAGHLSMGDCVQHFVFFMLATLPGGRDDVTLPLSDG